MQGVKHPPPLLVSGNTTWYRERLTADPVASSGNAEPSQRALRGGLKVRCGFWLKVRANPMG